MATRLKGGHDFFAINLYGAFVEAISVHKKKRFASISHSHCPFSHSDKLSGHTNLFSLLNRTVSYKGKVRHPQRIFTAYITAKTVKNKNPKQSPTMTISDLLCFGGDKRIRTADLLNAKA